MKNRIDRRNLMKFGLGAAGFALLPRFAQAALPVWDRTLLMIELAGGNDGLNTVIPFEDPLYAQLRPRLAVPREKVLHLNHELGLHPALAPLMPLWKEHEMAVVLGLGYPKPNHSHFRSIEIWETASDSDEVLEQGWVADLLPEPRLPLAGTPAQPAHALLLGNGSAAPFEGGQMAVVALDRQGKGLRQAEPVSGDPELAMSSIKEPALPPALEHVIAVRALDRLAAHQIVPARLAQVKMQTGFPATPFGQSMETAARLLLAGIIPPVIKLSLGSFDTHANQAPTHEKLLGELAAGLAAFHQALDKAGLWDRVLAMTYSEFGRRAKENASQGTDHGTAAPHFLFGGRAKGGIFGMQPPLSQAKDNDLVFTTDFRSYYSAIAEHWWRVPGIAGFKPVAGLLG
jgi:uncharacterized protein (DUF1501 family)